MLEKLPCKRFWEGAIGIVLIPRKQKTGKYFWSFAFVRAFKRKGSDKWEYTQHYGQNHAEALGRAMGKALHFMEQHDATQFVENSQAACAANVDDISLDSAELPSHVTTH